MYQVCQWRRKIVITKVAKLKTHISYLSLSPKKCVITFLKKIDWNCKSDHFCVHWHEIQRIIANAFLLQTESVCGTTYAVQYQFRMQKMSALDHVHLDSHLTIWTNSISIPIKIQILNLNVKIEHCLYFKSRFRQIQIQVEMYSFHKYNWKRLNLNLNVWIFDVIFVWIHNDDFDCTMYILCFFWIWITMSSFETFDVWIVCFELDLYIYIFFVI